MPWNETTRGIYDRKSGHYASDLSDAGWVLIEPNIPAPNRNGRLRKLYGGLN